MFLTLFAAIGFAAGIYFLPILTAPSGPSAEQMEMAKSNAQLVEKAVHIVDQLGGTMATAAEARQMLGLKPL